MNRYVTILVVLLLIACKTKQPVVLDNPILKEIDEQQISSIYIPIKLAKQDLEKNINERIGEVIFEDDNLNGDNISVRATRKDSIRLSLRDSTILYTVPLHIWVQKKIAILGNTEAEGALTLQFATKYQLKEDWTIQTQTKIEDYEWLEKPKINVLGANIPVAAIADRILLSSKERITNEIDKLVSNGLSIKGYVEKAWTQIQQPILVSKEYNSSLKITPYALAIAPFQLKNDTITSTLFVQGLSEVAIGKSNAFAENASLPPLKVSDIPAEPFSIRLLAKIPFEELEEVARENIIGETYSFGKKDIKVEDVKLRKEGGKLAVDVTVSGDHEGDLYFKGIPSFNARKNQIDVEKIEFKLATKNFLLKSAKWLFTDLIINKIEGNLQYNIEEDLGEIKKQIQQQLTNYEIQSGINVEGDVADLKIIEVGMGETTVDAVVEL